MKSAEEWLKERVHSLKGVEPEMIREIQRDALAHAEVLTEETGRTCVVFSDGSTAVHHVKARIELERRWLRTPA